MSVECQPGRRDEFPIHPGGCRIAPGMSAAIRRLADSKGVGPVEKHHYLPVASFFDCLMSVDVL